MLNKESTPEEIREALEGSPWEDHGPKWWNLPNVVVEFRNMVNDYIPDIPEYRGHTEPRGAVVCAGGERLFTNAWVCVNMLRYQGFSLPIEMWHLGPGEMDDKMREIIEPLGVEVIDAYAVRQEYPMRICNGYEVKPYAIQNTKFKEVMLIDCDNVVVTNPEFFFNSPEFEETGAIFFPDFGWMEPERLIWDATGVPYRHEPEFESGQIFLDRERAWKAICMTVFLNAHSDFVFQHIHGDKDTFRIGFHKMEHKFAMPERGIDHVGGCTMCQHDFQGNRVFQHRNMCKWELLGENRRIAKDGFLFEEECLEFLEELRQRWSGIVNSDLPLARDEGTEGQFAGKTFLYRRVGHDERVLEFKENGTIGKGGDRMERTWRVFDQDGVPELWVFGDGEVTCRLVEDSGRWTGQWERHEQMPIELIPQ